MSDYWYVRIRGQISGPFDRSQVESLARRQRLGRHDEISSDKIRWQRAAEFPEFFASTTAGKVRKSPHIVAHGTRELTAENRPLPVSGRTPAPAPPIAPREGPNARELQQLRLKSPMQAQLIWMFGSAIAGLTLFGILMILALPRLRASYHKNTNPVADKNDLSAARGLISGTSEATNTAKLPLKVSNGTAAANNGEPTGSDTSDQKPSKSSAVSGSTQALSGSGGTSGLPANVVASSKPAANQAQSPVTDPFSKLPADQMDGRLAILDLFADSIAGWDLVLVDPASLKMELLGSQVFHQESVAKYELKSSHDGAAQVWTLSLQSKNGALELGEFRHTATKSAAQLSFNWRDGAKSSANEAGVVKYLAVGMSAGDRARVCRLGPPGTKALIPCQFADEKQSEVHVFIDIDPVLAKAIQANDSKLLIDLNLIGDLVDYGADEKDVLHGMYAGERRTLSLTASSGQQNDPEWAIFQNDPQLAVLEVEPRLVGKSLGIDLAAFATVAIYKEADFSKAMKGPPAVPIKSKIALSSESLRARLNAGLAKRISHAIAKVVNSKGGTDSSDAFLGVGNNASADLAQHQSRHKPESLKWLWNVLSGGPDKSTEESSIRGAINSSKIGVQIAYQCEFEGQKYSLVVYQASK